MTDTTDVLNGNAQGQLRSIVERLEHLNEERAAITEGAKEIMAEAKGNGFDPKAIREVIRYRAQDKAKRQEMEAIVDLYLTSVGEA